MVSKAASEVGASGVLFSFCTVVLWCMYAVPCVVMVSCIVLCVVMCQ